MAQPSPSITPINDPSRLDRFLIIKESRKSLWGDSTEAVRTLYTFEDSPMCVPQRSAELDKLKSVHRSCVHSEYAVDKDADIIIDFTASLKERFQGLIRVRARIMGSRPIELPVENFTTVSDDRLAQELVVNIKDPKYFFQDTRQQFVDEVAELNGQLTEYKALLDQLDRQLETVDATLNTRTQLTLQRLTIQGLDLVRTLVSIQAQVQSHFLDSGAQKSITDDTFRLARNTSMALLHQLSRIQIALRSDWLSYTTALTKCSAAETEPNTLRTCRQRQRDAMSTQSQTLRQRLALTTRQAEGTTHALVQQLVSQTDAIRTAIATDLAKQLAEKVRPGRIKLRRAKVNHGDIVEVIITSSTAQLEFQGGMVQPVGQPQDVFEVRLRLRAVSTGFSSRVASSFVLVERLNDTSVATATSIPSNFKPTAGGALMFRYRTLGLWSDWLLPSFGLLVTIPDFDPNQTVELGVGPTLGILNESVHLGLGWNLSVSEQREYVFVGFDFLKTIDNFSALFGQ